MSAIADEVVLTSRYWQSYQPGSARSTVKSVHQPIATFQEKNKSVQ